jgi:predicted lipid-binding transport protein (Tim44 family)
MIVLAFANGDRRALKDLLSSEVYESFETVIRRSREARAEDRNAVRSITRPSWSERKPDRAAQLTVRFVSQMITATRQGRHGCRQRRYGRDITDVRPSPATSPTRSELEAWREA